MTIEIEGRSSIPLTEVGGSKPPGRKTRPQPGDMRHGRSPATNGRRMFVAPDASDRAWSRRRKDIFDLLVGDGSSEELRQQGRRCASLALECEKLESSAAAGKTIDLDTYGTLSDHFALAIQCLSALKATAQAHHE